jgi:hypothetical protein
MRINNKKQKLIILSDILILAGFGFSGEGEENTKINANEQFSKLILNNLYGILRSSSLKIIQHNY